MRDAVKYPKTMHLPWSPGLQNDDRVVTSLKGFEGEEIVVTEKMDGENTTLYTEGLHARSIDGRHHPSRDWVKGFHGSIRYLIPEGIRVCGENLYAEHSIRYESLTSYFLGFNIWEGDLCWDWDRTVEMFEELDIEPVPVLWRGMWEEAPLEFINQMCTKCDEVEGYVVRVVREFQRDEFQSVVAKYVRKNHIQTDQHWMAKPVVPNGLKR